MILPPCLTFCTISPQCIFIVCFYCLAFTLLALYCRNIAAYHILLRVSHLFFLPFSHTPSTYHSTPLRNPVPIARHSHTGPRAPRPSAPHRKRNDNACVIPMNLCRPAFMPLTLYCRNIAAYHILLRVSHLFFLPFSHTPSTYHSTPLRNPAPIARHSHTGQPCACGQHKDKQTLGERRHLARSCAAWRRTSLVPLRLERSASVSAAPYAARARHDRLHAFLKPTHIRNIVHIFLKILLQSFFSCAIITTSISGKSGSSDRKSVSLF